MSTLTGNQIKDTYQGLLKLANSSTGITQSLQAIEDGLGNNTGIRIATNSLTAPNVANVDFSMVPDYMGIGFNSGAGTAFAATTQNKTLYGIFYDSGVHSYSAITYNLGTLTSTSDVVSMAFYSAQLVAEYGVAPKNLIMSGITLESSGSTGIKTTTLPSTLSFSGTGGGWYVAAYYISNSGTTPTVRYSQALATQINQSFVWSLGFYLQSSGLLIAGGNRQGPPSLGLIYPLNLPFQTSYSISDIQNNIGNQSSAYPGFALNVIR